MHKVAAWTGRTRLGYQHIKISLLNTQRKSAPAKSTLQRSWYSFIWLMNRGMVEHLSLILATGKFLGQRDPAPPTFPKDRRVC